METLDINKDSGAVTYEYAVDGMGVKCVAPLKYWPAFKKIYDLEVIDDDDADYKAELLTQLCESEDIETFLVEVGI